MAISRSDRNLKSSLPDWLTPVTLANRRLEVNLWRSPCRDRILVSSYLNGFSYPGITRFYRLSLEKSRLVFWGAIALFSDHINYFHFHRRVGVLEFTRISVLILKSRFPVSLPSVARNWQVYLSDVLLGNVKKYHKKGHFA